MKIFKDNLELNAEFPFFINEVVLKKEDNCTDSFHWHSFFEITYIRSGSGYYFVNGKQYEVEEGDIIIFNNVEPHGWKVEEDMDTLVMIFSSSFVAEHTNFFNLDYLKPFIERGSNFKNKIEKEDTITKEIARILKEIHREWEEKNVGYQLMIKADVLRILTFLIRYSQDNEKSDEFIQDKKLAMKRLEDAFDYISEHYCDKITLEEAAKSAFMSPNYFSSYFRKVTDISFSEYLVKLRIEKANELMKNSDLTTADIAIQCGFNNMSNFYRLYKKQMGNSPRDKRREQVHRF
jgi:AraC-type DNA-binding domain-containing proteins